MKRFLHSSLILIITLPTLLAQSGIKPYSLSVKEFTELKVTDGINVEYFCNPEKAGTVAFDAPDSLASAILFDPNGKGKLEIKLASRSYPYRNLPVVRVYSSYLTKVENSGDSTIRVISTAPGPQLDAKLIGNGKIEVADINVSRLSATIATGRGSITLAGKAASAKLAITGTGKIEAYDLLISDAEAKIMGTGWIQCNVADNLKVSGLGTGSVTFKGNPIVRVKALSLKVKRFE